MLYGRGIAREERHRVLNDWGARRGPPEVLRVWRGRGPYTNLCAEQYVNRTTAESAKAIAHVFKTGVPTGVNVPVPGRVGVNSKEQGQLIMCGKTMGV